MKKLSLLGLSLLLISASCKDEPDNKCYNASNPDCENYDPCFGTSPVSADFVVEQRFATSGDFSTVFIEDTIFPFPEAVKFRALEDSAYYRWELGTEVVEGYDKQEIIRALNVPLGTYVNKLTVTKEPDTLCHPLDDGVDTQTRSFEVISACKAMIINRFKGVFTDNPNDSVTIEFYFGDFQANPAGPNCENSRDIWAVGIMQNTSAYIPKYDTIPTVFDLNDGFSDKRIEWKGSGSGSMKGTAELNRSERTIRLNFTYANVNRQFSGIVKN